MKTAANVLILLAAVLTGCQYLTPPVTNISGPRTEIVREQTEAEKPRVSTGRRLRIVIRRPGPDPAAQRLEDLR